MMEANKTKSADDVLRKLAWDYFQLHSSQRLTTFNFYLVISSVVAAGLVSTFQKDYRMPRGGILLGCLLLFFSFVFWMLDRRNRTLIKNAEAALRFYENETGPADTQATPHPVKIFSRDEFETGQRKSNRSVFFWKNHYSYSDCFNFVFIGFGLVGIAGAVAAFLLAR